MQVCIVSEGVSSNGSSQTWAQAENFACAQRSMSLKTAIRSALHVLLRDPDAATSALSDAEDPAGFASRLVASESLTDALVYANDVLASFPRDASFLDQLSVFFATWFEAKRCPLLDQSPAAEGVSVLTRSRDQVVSVKWEVLETFIQACQAADEDWSATIPVTAAFLDALGGARGLLTCLGFRETVGSRTLVPLTRAQCMASFLQLQSSKEKLTVGARAFTKHCARSSDGYWGKLKGNDAAKNAIALAKVEHILDNAVWKNVHSLPHGEATFELRDARGYGARWYIGDQSFRGFLEPHMENGHENRWRH